MKPASSFRSRYAYDNLLYMAAGQIIPAVTGISWDDYVRRNIFAPLGMNESSVSNTAFTSSGDYAFPHVRLDGVLRVTTFEDVGNVGPAAAINSSAADMAKWVRLQLNRGKFVDRAGRLFSERQSTEMWSAQTILSVVDPVPALASEAGPHDRHAVSPTGSSSSTTTRVANAGAPTASPDCPDPGGGI